MKKVLSVLLAAAMVMGMSVSAFAADADYSWGSNANGDADYNLGPVDFHNALVINNDHANAIVAGSEVEVEPGDDIYFALGLTTTNANAGAIVCGKTEHTHKAGECAYLEANGVTHWFCEKEEHTHGDACKASVTTTEAYKGKIDKDWSINIKGNEYVEKASFAAWTATGWSTKAADLADVTLPKYVKVEIVDELDEVSSKEVKFFMYLADDATDAKTSTLKVVATFANLGEYTVDFEWTNDVDEAGVWKVAKDKKGTAVFDFEDEAYFTVKMVSEEKVVLNLSMAYDKAIDKAYNEYDADLTFYNFKGSKDAFTKTGELLIPAKEATFIYEIVDGELVEVDAEYVDEYKLEGTNKKYAGWLIETKELGYYVVADDELVVAEVETEVEAPVVEAEKANPETGAADFVGAAVAMAVVSVAAAGALALKK